MAGPVEWCSPDNHTCNFMSHPLVEPVCGDQTPATSQRIPQGFVAAVSDLALIIWAATDGSFAHDGIKPQRIKDNSRGSFRFCRMIGDRLRGGNVVAGIPVWFIGDGVEIFLDNLLSPRKPIAAAHRKIMADRTGD